MGIKCVKFWCSLYLLQKSDLEKEKWIWGGIDIKGNFLQNF